MEQLVSFKTSQFSWQKLQNSHILKNIYGQKGFLLTLTPSMENPKLVHTYICLIQGFLKLILGCHDVVLLNFVNCSEGAYIYHIDPQKSLSRR